MLLFNNKTPKKILYNGLNVAKLVYNSLVVWMEKVLTLLTGYPITLTNSTGDDLVDYKVYGESVQDGEPTPDVPIEIESVGEKTSNLFDNDINASNVVKDGNDIVVKSYASGTGITPSQFLEMTGLKIGDKFTIKRSFTVEKGTASTVTGAIRFLKSDGSSGYFGLIGGSDKVKTVTIPADFNDDTYSSLYFYGVSTAENGQRIVRFSNVQIVKGSYTTSTIPEYEPYGYKVPVTVRGKNLFNVEKAKIESNWEGTSYKKFVPFVFKKGVHYTISMSDNLCYKDKYPFDASTTQVAMVVNFENKWGGTTIGNSTLTTKRPTVINVFNETEDTYLVLFHSNTLSKEKIFETIFPNLQIEVGDTATEYEPYVEPITTNIYLKEPLRKLGDKSDYIDFESGKVIRRIKELKLTNVNYKYTWIGKNGVSINKVLDGIYDRPKGLCNRETRFTANGGEKTSIWLGVNTTHLYWIGILDYLGFTTLDEMNEWLQNNPTYVYYGSNKTSEEIIELPTIPTHQGTNIIEVDTTIKPSNMEVQYYAKGV